MLGKETSIKRGESDFENRLLFREKSLLKKETSIKRRKPYYEKRFLLIKRRKPNLEKMLILREEVFF